MKKVQLPVIGGVRKVIRPGSDTTVGSTIAEVGSGTITLAQLAALIQNILNNNNNVVGNGPPPPATLVVGPGLSGGGTLVGNVPLNLTAVPFPYSLEDGSTEDPLIIPGPTGPRGPQGVPGQFLMPEDGADGDWGPPGAAGATGATGATGPQGPAGTGTGSGGTGTLMMFVPEDPSDNDTSFFVPGPIGPQGATGATGATGTGSGGTGALQMWIVEDTSYEDATLYHLPTTLGGVVAAGNSTLIGPLTVLSTINMGTTAGSNATLFFVGITPNIVANAPAAVLQILSSSNGNVQVGTNNAQNIVLNGTGTVTLQHATGGNQLTVLGSDSVNAILAQAGSLATESSQIWEMTTGFQTAIMYGDGGFAIGRSNASVLAPLSKGYGTINVQNGIYRNGVPIFPFQDQIAEDPYWEDEIYRGPTNGPGLNNGPLVVNSLTSSAVTYAVNVHASLVSGQSNGVYIAAGGNATDIALGVVNAAGNQNLMYVQGNGQTICGPPNTANAALTVLSSTGYYPMIVSAAAAANPSAILFYNGATLNCEFGADGGQNMYASSVNGDFVLRQVSNGSVWVVVNSTLEAIQITSAGNTLHAGFVGASGATPAVTAGRTDIGVTTTGTVITTAGGISLPALASTFWVVNVNGVKYGIPCFAL